MGESRSNQTRQHVLTHGSGTKWHVAGEWQLIPYAQAALLAFIECFLCLHVLNALHR